MTNTAKTSDAAAPKAPVYPHLVLASGSPRRRVLLTAAGVSLEVRPNHADETWPEGQDLQTALLRVARRKLAHIGAEVPWALAADTIVAIDERVLGKPADVQAASAMLRHLSGRTHVVMTGFVLIHHNSDGVQHSVAEAVTTQVRFRTLCDVDIARYVASGDCFDKAGGYGIQSLGGHLVDAVNGSYTNIIGLPLAEVLCAIDRLQSGS